jgi:hypothetical protein
MEFNDSKHKVVGIIEKELGDKNARIKVIALLSEKEQLLKFTENELRIMFPPSGYVFEPGFFYNHKYNLNNYISFIVEENVKATTGQDKYKLRFGESEIKNFGVYARMIGGFKQIDHVTNLNTIILQDDEISTSGFYGITEKYIVGKLKVINGKIEPALHHRIKMWDLSDSNFVTIEDKIRLVNEPQGDFQILDCLDDKQLFEWFREYLNQIEPEYVKLLDNQRSWRTKIPEKFSTIDSEKLEADKIRIKRIEEKFDLLELSRTDIKTLVDSSENLKGTFIKYLEKHKEEFKENYQHELELYKSEIEQQKSLLNSEIKKLQNKKESEETLLIKLVESITEIKDELTNLKENKDRIIQDFSIIKEVLQGQPSKKIFSNEKASSFTIEEIIHSEYDNVEVIDEFEAQLRYKLSKNALNPKFAKKIIDVISLYNAVLIKNIKIGIATAEATDNAKYIIQQVEPDWLHFNDFWNNGLSEIWNSAHNSPETFHFLLLEDINMSALECYCRPVLDIINGIRKKIPYGQTAFPSNLKILATIAPFNEPEIGLPIYRNTLEGWGAVGFREKIKENVDSLSKPENKSLSTSFFFGRIIDEFDRENIRNDVNAELDNIFDV